MFRRKYFGFVELPCLDRRKRKGSKLSYYKSFGYIEPLYDKQEKSCEWQFTALGNPYDYLMPGLIWKDPYGWDCKSSNFGTERLLKKYWIKKLVLKTDPKLLTKWGNFLFPKKERRA